jgi:hypothetical protein
MKRKACAEVGICSIDVDLHEDISEPALVAEVHRLNADPAVHGTAPHFFSFFLLPSPCLLLVTWLVVRRPAWYSDCVANVVISPLAW